MNAIAETRNSDLPTKHDLDKLEERLDALEMALAKLEAQLKEMSHDTPSMERGYYS